MIRSIIPVLEVLFYSFGFAQDPFETSDLSFASEQIIFQSASEYSKTDTFSYALKLAFDEEDKRRSHPLRSWSLLREIQYWTWGRIWWGEVTKEMVTGVVVHSDMDKRGPFSCNNDLINQLQHNIKEGYRLHCIFLQKG